MSARILSMLSDFMVLWLNVSRALSVVRGLMGLGCVQILFLWMVLDEHGNCWRIVIAELVFFVVGTCRAM